MPCLNVAIPARDCNCKSSGTLHFRATLPAIFFMPSPPSRPGAPASPSSNQKSKRPTRRKKVSTVPDDVAIVPVQGSSHTQLGHFSAIGRSNQGNAGCASRVEPLARCPGRPGDFRRNGRLHFLSESGEPDESQARPHSSRLTAHGSGGSGSLKRRTRPPVLLPDLHPAHACSGSGV